MTRDSRWRLLPVVCVALIVPACGDGDGEAGDAGAGDAGAGDASAVDATAPVDGGGSSDASPSVDAGDTDAGSPTPVDGIWISRDEVMALDAAGDAWDAVVDDAVALSGTADISDQDSNHDVHTFAAALRCVRLGEGCAEAIAAVVSAIGTEETTLTTPRTPPENQWLPVGRNLAAYVIAADLLELRDDGDPSSDGSRVAAWIAAFDGRVGSEGVEFQPFGSGSNASAQTGFAYAAVAAYLADEAMLERAWDAFRTYACDPTAPDREGIDVSKGVEFGWAHDDAAPCAVNPLGTTKVVPAGLPGAGTEHRIDGVIINDMRRGGEYQWPPGYTQYPWVGLEGFVPAALVLHRRGYPAFTVADAAVWRTVEYLQWLGGELGQDPTCTADCWWDHDRATDVKHLVAWFYDEDLPYETPTGRGRTIGYTDWTHPR